MKEPIFEKDEQLKEETVKRIEKMKAEFTEPTIKLFDNTYKYDGIIAQSQITFSSLCEHHQVAFEGEATVAYIPGKYLTGLSKLARIVEFYLNPTLPTVQEKATQQIMEHLKETIIDAKGFAVIIKAKHNCVCYRGVKKPSTTSTSAVSGVFKDNPQTRHELLSIIK